MNSKGMLASLVTVAIVNTAVASNSNEAAQVEKKSQATTISNIFGTISPAINSPECTVRPTSA